MNIRYKLDLQLTCLEFDGLYETLRYYASRLVSVDLSLLTEDDLLLGSYYMLTIRAIIDRQTWINRRCRRDKQGAAKRYTFKVDFHLVRALYRVLLTSPFSLSNERQALLAQINKVLTNRNAVPPNTVLATGIDEAHRYVDRAA